jgi:hypothetical protein
VRRRDEELPADDVLDEDLDPECDLCRGIEVARFDRVRRVPAMVTCSSCGRVISVEVVTQPLKVNFLARGASDGGAGRGSVAAPRSGFSSTRGPSR